MPDGGEKRDLRSMQRARGTNASVETLKRSPSRMDFFFVVVVLLASEAVPPNKKTGRGGGAKDPEERATNRNQQQHKGSVTWGGERCGPECAGRLLSF